MSLEYKDQKEAKDTSHVVRANLLRTEDWDWMAYIYELEIEHNSWDEWTGRCELIDIEEPAHKNISYRTTCNLYLWGKIICIYLN